MAESTEAGVRITQLDMVAPFQLYPFAKLTFPLSIAITFEQLMLYKGNVKHCSLEALQEQELVLSRGGSRSRSRKLYNQVVGSRSRRWYNKVV